MGAICITTTHRSASSLGIMAEASNAGTAIRSVARQLIEQGRNADLPVHITDRATGFILARIVSLAAAAHPETYTMDVVASLPRQRAGMTLHGDMRAA
jgi:hypothetical protein